jgi:hypothetical protein
VGRDMVKVDVVSCGKCEGGGLWSRVVVKTWKGGYVGSGDKYDVQVAR